MKLDSILSAFGANLSTNEPPSMVEKILDLAGIRDPEHLGDIGGGPGGTLAALLEATGFPTEIAQMVGLAGDACTGNIPGVIEHGAKLHGADEGEAAAVFSFIDQLPV